MTWVKSKEVNSVGLQNPSLDKENGGRFRVGEKWARNVVLKQEHPDGIKGCILKLVGNKAEQLVFK